MVVSDSARAHAITALSMLVNTLSFMCSEPTAVITVRLLTDTTKAVSSTRTRESREPLLAARSTPSESRPSVLASSSMPRRSTRSSAWRENCSGSSRRPARASSGRTGRRRRRPCLGALARGAVCAGWLGRTGRDGGAGEATRRYERGVRLDRAHSTSVTLVSLTPDSPSTVTVVPAAVDCTLSTLPRTVSPRGLE